MVQELQAAAVPAEGEEGGSDPGQGRNSSQVQYLHEKIEHIQFTLTLRSIHAAKQLQ